MAPDRPWVCLVGIVPSCPNPSQPDRIGSKFLPSEELFIGPQSNGIWRQKRDEGILGKPAPPPSHTGFLCPATDFEKASNAFSYLWTGICESLLGTSLRSFLMFTGVGTHEPAGQNSIHCCVEMWNFGVGESGKYLIWWSLWFVSGVRADICGSISPRSRPQGGHLPVSLPQTWNFIQQPPVTVKTPVDIQNKTKSIMKDVLFLNPTTTALDRKKEKRLSLQALLFAIVYIVWSFAN